MAGSKQQGQMCQISRPLRVEDGTLCQMPSPLPGSLGLPYQSSAAGLPSTRPRSVEDLVVTVQREFPQADIRITGRARTVRRQAELIAQRRRQNPQQFIQTYRPAAHITEMNQWVIDNPQATEAQTVDSFVQIIERARRTGAVVSYHLSDTARDISIPAGGQAIQTRVRQRIEQLGGGCPFADSILLALRSDLALGLHFVLGNALLNLASRSWLTSACSGRVAADARNVLC